MSELEYTEHGWRAAVDTTRHHRSHFWDYKGIGIYHITLTVENRYPLFGELVAPSPDEARIVLNTFGKKVDRYARDIPKVHAPKGIDLKVLALQVMPDHIHLVLQVLQPMTRSVGQIVRSYKSACTSLYKREYLPQATNAGNYTGENDNLAPPQVVVDFARIFTSRGSIWQFIPAGYHERILRCRGQLDAMIQYVKANPRRLALKRANPDLFRIHQQTQIAGVSCTTLGNMFLAEQAFRAVLQCSRKLSQAEIDTRKNECLDDAANGIVFISAAISEGEKQIARALREAGYPLIILLEKGFPKPDDPHYKFFKPSGVYFEACAVGKLLLVEPHPNLFEQPEVIAQTTAKTGDIPHDALRYRFVALNVIASLLAPSMN
jgi:REP element-mobilizing transposase RayT